MGLERILDGFRDPEHIIKAATAGARKAADQGTGMLIPMSNVLNMVLVEHGVTKLEGIPVLDTIGAQVKVTELMVDLKEIGITRSKRGLYESPTKEELADALKLYGIN